MEIGTQSSKSSLYPSTPSPTSKTGTSKTSKSIKPPKKPKTAPRSLRPVFARRILPRVRRTVNRPPAGTNKRLVNSILASLRKREGQEFAKILFKRNEKNDRPSMAAASSFQTEDLNTPKKAFSLLGPRCMESISKYCNSSLDRRIDKPWKYGDLEAKKKLPRTMRKAPKVHQVKRKDLPTDSGEKKKKKRKHNNKPGVNGRLHQQKKLTKTVKKLPTVDEVKSKESLEDEEEEEEKTKKEEKAQLRKRVAEQRQKRFDEWVKTAALPKKVFEPPPIKSKAVDIDKIGYHISEMARPMYVTQKYIDPQDDPYYVDPFRVKSSTQTYIPSDRIQKLAECPSRWFIENPAVEPGAVPEAALKFEATPRIAELAAPKSLPEEYIEETNEDPFAVNKSALTFKPSKRFAKLATPKVRVGPEIHLKEDPYAVSKKALTAKIHKRLVELAEPKLEVDPEIHLKPNPYEINRNALLYVPSPRIRYLAAPNQKTLFGFTDY